MSYFIDDYLKVFAPHVVPTLISPDCMRQIMATAEPLRTVDGGIFECRLGDESDSADFSVRLSQQDLGELPALERLPPAQREIWARIHDLAAAWRRADSDSDSDSALAAGASKLWLEYDIGGEAAAPSVFVGLGKLPEQARRCAAASLELLLPAQAQASWRWVEQVFAALPVGARVAFLGVLLPRPGQPVNLNIIALAADGIAPLLAAIGWPGEVAVVAELTRALADNCDRLALSVSFDPVRAQVLPRIGLECFVDRPAALPVWDRMLAGFVADKLCTARKREAVLAWSGVAQVDPRRPDASNLARVVSLFGGQLVGAFTRRINHLELSHVPGQGTDLKAYLDFGHVIGRPAGADAAGEIRRHVEAVRDHVDGLARATPGLDPVADERGRALAQVARLEAGMAVLDLGCGDAGLTVALAQAAPALAIDAVDLAHEAAKRARRRVDAADLGARLRIHVGDYHDLAFHDRSFDRVLLLDSLRHAYNLPRLWAGVHRVLRAGGCVIVEDDFVREGALDQDEARALAEHDRRELSRSTTLATTLAVLAEVGLELESVEPLTGVEDRRAPLIRARICARRPA